MKELEEKAKIKSRNIPLSDYFSILHLEYYSYLVRSRIYAKPHNEKYKSYCTKKKLQIEQIAEVNVFPSIFSNSCLVEIYEKKFLNDWGLPNFQYRDVEAQEKQGFWDKLYWFEERTPIKILIDSKEVITLVKNNFPKESKLVANIKGKDLCFDYVWCSRILKNDFLTLSNGHN
jgi:hypothetical protein